MWSEGAAVPVPPPLGLSPVPCCGRAAVVVTLIVLLVAIEALVLVTALVEWTLRRLREPARYEDTSRGRAR